MGAARVDAAREAALDVLRAVSEQDAYANLALAKALRETRLSGRDAAFVTELVSGTLRRRGSYDAVLAAVVDRPLPDLDGVVLDVLRMGCHQLLHTRVASHAAVSTSVALVRGRVGHRPSGFVNAVLRAVSRQPWEGWVAQVAPDRAVDLHGHLSVAHAHPRWIVDAFAEALGERAEAELEGLLASDNAPPRVTLVARPGLVEPAELITELGDAARTTYSPHGVVLAGGDPAAAASVREGRAAAQDEGSQLVASALAAAPLEAPDRRWTDLCAGPGGKAALLGALALPRHATVLAVEKQPHRADLVRTAVRALPSGTVTVMTGDARQQPTTETFDRVLVDAPCTGLGALRRRPEARWRREEGDLADLVPLQRELLDAALSRVRSGGVVAYVTCSPLVQETREVVSAVLSDRGDAQLEDAAPLVGVEDAEGDLPGTVQLWPHRHGTDAMFLALLRRH